MLSYKKVAVAVTVIFSIILLEKSISHTLEYGGTDLRGRIIGSRLTGTSYQPYFYKWDPKDGDFYLDPNEPTAIIANSNTVTPAVLYTIYPLALIPYKTIRVVWTFVQFGIAFACLYLLSISRVKKSKFWLSPVIMCILFLLCSDLWLYNIEKGQIYILYALFFSLMYWLYHLNSKLNHFLSGLVGGLFIFYRPLAIVIGIGFVIQKNYRWILGNIAGLIIGGLLFVAPRPDYWKQYFNAMKEYSYRMTGTHTQPPDRSDVEKPTIVENMDNIKHSKIFQSGGMMTLNQYLSFFGIYIRNTHTAILYSILVLSLSLVFLKKKSYKISSDHLFLFGFLLYILLEIIMIAPRAGYSAIQWIFPLFIAWKYILANRFLLVLYITSILFLHQFPFLFPFQKDMAELLFILITFLIIFPSIRNTINNHTVRLAKRIFT